MPKREHVPETRPTEAKVQTGPNREQRRHPEKFEHPENEPIARDADQTIRQDVPEPHAKGKKTADKWNQ